ncbi:hypothetical protein [Microbacterium sp. NPDC076895]|jgi:hypothetical protein|uniref:hypothetical protein n=1 Tax=Microbacterium sp. NPDC076895 TaxID=3154957 RepID=UPI003447A8D8
MPTPLNLADAETAVDAQTFASRAARVGDGAVRLRASSGILVMTCAPIAPRGILDTSPTILGVRVLAADPELECDLVVDGASLRAHGVTLELPDAGLRAAWAGISPPASGWTVTGEIASTDLVAAAHRGMEEVATSVPSNAGEDVVRQIRAAVWGAPDAALGGIPRGVGFVSKVLGFLGQDAESVPLRESGPWRRLSLRRGHVLVRGSAANSRESGAAQAAR